MVQVLDPRQVRIEHLAMDGPDGVTRLRQTSAGRPSSVYYNDLHVSSVYSTMPGIELVRLPATARVRLGITSGFVRVIDCGQATVLGQIHLGRLVIGDLYNETNDRVLLAEGGARKGDGRITLGLSKASTFAADTVHRHNDEGRIALCTGGWQHQGQKDSVILRQQGERPGLSITGTASRASRLLDPPPTCERTPAEERGGFSWAVHHVSSEN
jgi:hypothetical protein